MKKQSSKHQGKLFQIYHRHLEEVRGLAPTTRQRHLEELGRFLEAESIGKVAGLPQLTPAKLTGYLALRLQAVRLFAQFWQAYDPQTEIPPAGYFGSSSHRRAVHIYSRAELGQLLQSAANLQYPHPLRGQTLSALFGLLDCTGLRLGEALELTDQDIDWSAGVLTIRRAKGGHQRLIPVQPSTVEALQRYRAVRDRTLGAAPAPRFFINYRARRLQRSSVEWSFRQIRRHLGWNQRPVPRLHDLRHSFAVRTLLAWYQSAEPIEPKLWTLSTYLGHQHPAHTYWYLTAVPELMALSQQRFARAQAWASGGTADE